MLLVLMFIDCLSRMICVCMWLVLDCLWNELVCRKNCVLVVIIVFGSGGGICLVSVVLVCVLLVLVSLVGVGGGGVFFGIVFGGIMILDFGSRV